MTVFVSGTMNVNMIKEIGLKLQYLGHEMNYLITPSNIDQTNIHLFYAHRLALLLQCDAIICIENPTGRDKIMYDFEKETAEHLKMRVWDMDALNAFVADKTIQDWVEEKPGDPVPLSKTSKEDKA